MQVLVGKLFPFTMFICLMNIIVLPLVSSSSQQHVKSIDSIADKKDSIHKILSLLISTAGAVMSVKNFNNSFNNHHQRLGLALYGIIWLQALTGVLRPCRGSKGRSGWFFAHWLLGTAISILGIINIYTGLRAYHEKTSRSIKPWTIVLTAEISLIAFVYLFQDKWLYIQKQGLILGDESVTPKQQDSSSTEKQKESSSEKC
ncbi:hypothetical protein ES319_A07G198600v1 [Gossypium barbadense]|uniref:Cytochrome b561 domain-containing protein n=1 Tax=Gossypium barbadense TaxID=3634 RepID=A0A5J5V605_GOSBA|nr:hypothetical protein ES319_A07G198600v1 [Gossypium barbadense]